MITTNLMGLSNTNLRYSVASVNFNVRQALFSSLRSFCNVIAVFRLGARANALTCVRYVARTAAFAQSSNDLVFLALIGHVPEIFEEDGLRTLHAKISHHNLSVNQQPTKWI